MSSADDTKMKRLRHTSHIVYDNFALRSWGIAVLFMSYLFSLFVSYVRYPIFNFKATTVHITILRRGIFSFPGISTYPP
jgi:hypothetical protein